MFRLTRLMAIPGFSQTVSGISVTSSFTFDGRNEPSLLDARRTTSPDSRLHRRLDGCSEIFYSKFDGVDVLNWSEAVVIDELAKEFSIEFVPVDIIPLIDFSGLSRNFIGGDDCADERMIGYWIASSRTLHFETRDAAVEFVRVKSSQ